MKKYNLTGMSCAACSSKIEKAVSAIDGVESCVVSLLTNSMNVEGTASDEAVKAAVLKAGYGIKTDAEEGKASPAIGEETCSHKKRLIWSLVFLFFLMYMSMGHNMWGFPLPDILEQNPMAQGLLQLILTMFVLVINQRFFISGFKGIANYAPNMDTLVALGSGAAFIYSSYVLFEMSGVYVSGEIEKAAHYLHDLYFESTAMILTLITVGKLLELHSKDKTTDALKRLINLAPKTATMIKDGKEVVVLANQLNVGDVFVVRSGESIPTDGVIIEGSASVDESALTGESIPAEKRQGNMVFSATINKVGFIKCRVCKTTQDNTLSQIIKIMTDTAATKAPISKIADKVSGFFVPVVIGIAVITIIIWMIVNGDIGFALTRGISVLVISCPCALGLATPVAIMVGSGKGARNGILFKTASALEILGKTKVIAVDKTGTITEGKPEVTDILTFGEISEKDFLTIAASMEHKSEHPLAKAIVQKANQEGVDLAQTTNFETVVGNGISASINEKKYYAGNYDFVSKIVDVQDDILQIAQDLANHGKTPLFFVEEDEIIGIIAVADAIKNDSAEAIEELRKLGIRSVMITGDNEKTALAIAKQAGINNVFSGILPQQKAEKIKELMLEGQTAMVGDGINDAPSLIAANVGIAIGAGADIAVDAADVVLMKNSLMDVVHAVRLSRAALRIIYQNLFWAFVYNIIGIPLATGVFISAFGWQLNPMFAAAAMSLSSFSVVTNALRLNYINIKNKKERKSKMNTKLTIQIEGMMCPHCEANVKNTLEAMENVVAVEVSHKAGVAVIETNSEIDDDIIKKAIENKGYKVITIK